MSKPTFREKLVNRRGEKYAASIEREYAARFLTKVTANDMMIEFGLNDSFPRVKVLAQALANGRNAHASWIEDAVLEWGQGPNQELVDFLIKRSK